MKLGVALSGGGIRGIAHAGVLKALEESNIKIKYIGGTSSGSMISAAYAMGYTPDEIYNICSKYAKTIAKLNSNVIRREIKNFILNHKIKCQGVNSGEFIEEIFNKIAMEKGIEDIKQLKLPVVMTAVDISNGKEYLFTSQENNKNKYISDIGIGKAVRASCSFPGVYEPTKFKNKILTDGGVLDNIPVKAVKGLGAEKVIAVKFDSDRVRSNSNAIDILMKTSDIMSAKISEENLAVSDYVISIPTDGTGILDVNKMEFCYKSGYETTMKEIGKIKEILK